MNSSLENDIIFRSNWEEHSYIALCSTAECAAVRMLKNYTNLTNVYLCLDHDSAGIEGAIRLADILHEMGDYSVELLGSKGYLLEQTFGKLRCLLGKIESTEDTEQRQELLIQMANTAVAYCFCRDWQINNSCGIDKYIEFIKKEYKPYRDKQRSGDQLEDMKQYLASLEKELKAKDTFTNQECCEQKKKCADVGCLPSVLMARLGESVMRNSPKPNHKN